MLVADDNEAGVGVTLENVGEQGAGGLSRGVSVHNIDLGLGRLESSEVGRQSGFELLRNHLEIALRQNAFELTEHERMRREQADRELGTGTFGSHFRSG